MARYATKHLVSILPDGPLWRMKPARIADLLGVPLTTITGALRTGTTGVGVIGAADLAGYRFDVNFRGVLREDLGKLEAEQEAVRRVTPRADKLPLRLADIPGAVVDLIGRRSPDDIMGSFDGLRGVATEYGYAITESQDGHQGIAVTDPEHPSGWLALERRFPGLRIPEGSRDRGWFVETPQMLGTLCARLGLEPVEWTD